VLPRKDIRLHYPSRCVRPHEWKPPSISSQAVSSRLFLFQSPFILTTRFREPRWASKRQNKYATHASPSRPREMCIILKRRSERRFRIEWKTVESSKGWKWAKRFLPIIDGASFDLRTPSRRVCWFLKLLFLFEKPAEKQTLTAYSIHAISPPFYRISDSQRIFYRRVIFRAKRSMYTLIHSAKSFEVFLYLSFYFLFYKVSRYYKRMKNNTLYFFYTLIVLIEYWDAYILSEFLIFNLIFKLYFFFILFIILNIFAIMYEKDVNVLYVQ